MTKRRFIVTLADAAKADLADILDWSFENFGDRQTKRYASILNDALDTLTFSAKPATFKDRENIAPGMRSYQVARRGHRARHVLFYQVLDDRRIVVVRILHDSMDPSLHLPSNDED